MRFYCYRGGFDLGQEPLGTWGRSIWRDIKTVRGARRRAARCYGPYYRLYTFTDFYDDTTFTDVTMPKRRLSLDGYIWARELNITR